MRATRYLAKQGRCTGCAFAMLYLTTGAASGVDAGPHWSAAVGAAVPPPTMRQPKRSTILSRFISLTKSRRGGCARAAGLERDCARYVLPPCSPMESAAHAVASLSNRKHAVQVALTALCTARPSRAHAHRDARCSGNKQIVRHKQYAWRTCGMRLRHDCALSSSEPKPL